MRIVFSPHYCSFTLLPLSYIFLSWQHLFHVVACTALLYESWMAELQPGFNWMRLCSVYWYMQYCVPPLKKIKTDAEMTDIISTCRRPFETRCTFLFIFSVCDFLIRQSITYTPGWQSELVFLRCGQKIPIWMSESCVLYVNLQSTYDLPEKAYLWATSPHNSCCFFSSACICSLLCTLSLFLFSSLYKRW